MCCPLRADAAKRCFGIGWFRVEMMRVGPMGLTEPNWAILGLYACIINFYNCREHSTILSKYRGQIEKFLNEWAENREPLFADISRLNAETCFGFHLRSLFEGRRFVQLAAVSDIFSPGKCPLLTVPLITWTGCFLARLSPRI